MFGNDVQNVLWSGVLYFRGRFASWYLLLARPSLARYVKTSLFSQSPEIEHHTPNHCYVILSLGAKEQKPEQTEFLSDTLSYRTVLDPALSLDLDLDLQPPRVRINAVRECAEDGFACLGFVKTGMFSLSGPRMASPKVGTTRQSVPRQANQSSVQSFYRHLSERILLLLICPLRL